jgi:hypothetical protein
VRRAGAALAACALLAGCGGGGDKADKPERSAGPVPADASAERVVRGWIAALNRGDYDRAADYFAPGAIVQQTAVIHLRTHREAEAFNRSLPCKARVTEVRDQGRAVLATFKLLNGPGGRCQPRDGSVAAARVRCVIRHGRFLEWRQLPKGLDVPQGKSV